MRIPFGLPTRFGAASRGRNIPFSASGGALLFHLLSKLYERTSVIITTNLSFSEWATVFGDAKMGGQVFAISVEEKQQFRDVDDLASAARGFMATLPFWPWRSDR